MKYLLAIILALTIADTASACGRCGRFGRSCRFAAIKQAVVYPQYAAQASQTINIANFAYPVGATQYSSVAQISQLYATNPALALEHSSRVAERSVSTMQTAIEAITANNTEVIGLAKLQAATDHLRAAMHNSEQSSNVTLRITQSASGIKVEPIHSPEQGGGPSTSPTSSLLTLHCGECHGSQTNAPKGGLYFYDGLALNAIDAMKVLRILEGENVPAAMQALMSRLTDDDLSGLRKEIIGLTK